MEKKINFIKKMYINSEPKTLHYAEKFCPTFKIVILVVAPCNTTTHYIFTVMKTSYIVFVLSVCLYLFMVYFIVLVTAHYTWCVKVLRSPKEAFAAAMQSWSESCEKCVCLQGDYVEK